MTDPQTAAVRLPEDKPPGWANSLMKWALTTPGLQAMVGQGVALLSFDGRKTGKRYTIPVSYYREDDVVTVVTKKQRKWWHNFETPRDIELRLAGRVFAGEAAIETDDEVKLEFMVDYLEKRPIDAKAYGLAKEERSREAIARIIPHIVVIRIEIGPAE